jgi:hypothetical protein
MWVIDQMVRALTGCPMVEGTATDVRGQEYTYEEQGESEEYRAWVAARCEGGYNWDEGVIP